MQRLKTRDSAKTLRRVNYIEELEEEEYGDEEQLVLRVDGNGCKPFYMEGTMCGNYFRAIIDTGSQFQYSRKKTYRKLSAKKVVTRDMIDGVRYVDYNKMPLSLLGYQFVRLEVAGVTVSKARVLMAPNSGKSIVDRDWLVALRYKITQSIERGECEINQQSVNSPEEKQSSEVQKLIGEFPKLFRRKGCVKNYGIKINVKSETKITQQKGRRIPI